MIAAVPKDWNRTLVVFAHGGPSLIPYSSGYSLPDLDKFAILVKGGFAWIASSFRREGYGVGMAAEDTEHAREFFVEHFGQPRRTLLQGASYGALVAVKVLEQQAQNPRGQIYDGAILLRAFLLARCWGTNFVSTFELYINMYAKTCPLLEKKNIHCGRDYPFSPNSP